MVENKLAQDILAGRFVPGDVIKLDVESGNLTFSKGEVKSGLVISAADVI